MSSMRSTRRRLLDLGHDARSVAHDLACLHDVGKALDERQRKPVDAEGQSEVEISTVLFSQRRQFKDGIGNVDALAVRDGTAGHDLGDDRVIVEALDLELEAAIVDQQPMAGKRRGEDFRVRQGDRLGVAVAAAGNEADQFAGAHLDAAVLDGADADLRALQVLQDADRAADIVLEVADGLVYRGMILVEAVRKVQPEDIDAGQKQAAKHFGAGTCRADRCHDLGAPVASLHVASFRIGRGLRPAGRICENWISADHQPVRPPVS